MTNYVRTMGQQIVSNVVKRAMGGGSSSSDTSDYKKINRSGGGRTLGVGHGAGEGNPNTYQTLAFPLDVLSDPSMGNHGHYIQFFVNVQEKATIKFHPPKTGAENMKNALIERNLDKRSKVLKNPDGYAGINKEASGTESVAEDGVGSDAKGRGFGFKPASAPISVDAAVVAKAPTGGDAQGRVFGFKPASAPTSVDAAAATGSLSTSTGLGTSANLSTSSTTLTPTPVKGSAYVTSSSDSFERKIGQYLINQQKNFKETGILGGQGINKARAVEALGKEAARVSTFRGVRAATIRSEMCINMYMPASVQVTYGANYTDTNIGALSQQAMTAFNDIMNGNFDQFGVTVASAGEPLKEMLLQMMTSLVGTIGPAFGGLEATRAMQSGTIIGEKLELAFTGVPKRSFQYTFKMMPRSEAESEEVQKIVKAFKSNMLPELEEANARRLRVPNTFNIQYMYVNDVNQYIHNIGECVLESMNVTYGGDRYKTFTAVPGRGAPPVETTITLSFKEFHFLTRSDVENEGM